MRKKYDEGRVKAAKLRECRAMAYVEPEEGDPAPGTRVRVRRIGGTVDLGPGKFCGRVRVPDIADEAGPEWKFMTVAEIQLDEGGKIYDCMCEFEVVPERRMLN